MKNKFVTFVNNLNMRTKIIISFSLVLLPTFIICVYLSSLMNSILVDNANTSLKNANERISNSLSSTLSEIVNLSSTITSNSLLLEFFTTEYNSDFDLVYSMWKNADLSHYLNSYDKYISELHIYLDDTDVYTNGYIESTPKDIRQSDWYKTAITGKTQPFWIYSKNENYFSQSEYSLSLIRTIYTTNGPIGVLRIALSEDYFQTLFENEAAQFCLVDTNNVVFGNSNHDFIGTTLHDTNYFSNYDLKNLSYDSENYIYLNSDFSVAKTTGTFNVLSFSSKTQLSKGVRTVTNSAILFTILGLIIALYIGYFLSKMITNRLMNLSTVIHNAALGDLNPTFVFEGKDEIAELSKDFYIMLGSIKQLINDVYEINLQKQKLSNEQKDIQIQMLNSQINPHFLFNTLESIRMKALLASQNEIAEQMHMLSFLLRESLNMKNNPIEIKKELELCETYLKIQKFRFSSSLEFSINVLFDIEDIKILPFTIQPLVENSIKHGMENSDKVCTNVIVTLLDDDDYLIIKVYDDGKGISEELLDEIQSNLSDDSIPENHIGLKNINKRLKLLYGENFRLNITSKQNSGTLITLFIPKED